MEVDSNSEEVNEGAEDQESDHDIMWCLEYLKVIITLFFHLSNGLYYS